MKALLAFAAGLGVVLMAKLRSTPGAVTRVPGAADPLRPGAPLPPGESVIAPRSLREFRPVPPSVLAQPGTTYLGQADVPFFAEVLVTAPAIRAELIAMGFTPLLVTEQRPLDWPDPGADADWYVIADYTDAPQQVQVPGSVTRLWTETSVS